MKNHCPADFLDAVRESGRLLYRGEVALKAPKLLCPPFDLFDENTYNEKNAVIFFHCLEHSFASWGYKARPSLGHIGTSDLSEASKWGEAVSVWPLSDGEWSYVWPRNESTFDPSGMCCRRRESFVNDRDIGVALSSGKEVLFCCNFRGNPGQFLAFPSTWDSYLLKEVASWV